MAYGIFANISTSSEYKNWFNSNAGLNEESPFGVSTTTSPSTIEMSNAYMALKQRRPFVLEYYAKAGDTTPKSITMYINPEKLSFSNTKIIGKAITRGGIFYHHYGDDHGTLQLSGTTGLSGMTGIKILEELYFASGTLLRYNNFMPNQTYANVDTFEIYDYKDPVATAITYSSRGYTSENQARAINSRMASAMSYDEVDTNPYESCSYIIESLSKNYNLDNYTTIMLNTVASYMIELDSKNSLTYSQYYQKTKQLLAERCQNYDDSVITEWAYEICMNKYNEMQSTREANAAMINTYGLSSQSSISTRATVNSNIRSARSFTIDRTNALKNHLANIKNSYARDQQIRNSLRGGLNNIKDILQDKWLPRLITIYFENNAYLGFFETFNYNRDAKTNLVNYDLKFVIVKHYEFNNGEDPNKYVPTTPTVTPAPAPPPPAPKPTYDTYVVQQGDILELICERFYEHSSYQELRTITKKICVVNGLYDADAIWPGQVLKLPPKSELANISEKDYNGVWNDGR